MAASPLVKKYDALSLRERAMVALAVLGGAIFIWHSMFMEPLRFRRLTLDSELALVYRRSMGIVFDLAVIRIQELRGQTLEQMRARHFNLE